MIDDKKRRRPLTKAVLRGLYVLATLGAADLEGEQQSWLAPAGTFKDTSARDVDAARAWLFDRRARAGLGGSE